MADVLMSPNCCYQNVIYPFRAWDAHNIKIIKMVKATFKVGDKAWIVEQELGGTEFIKCEIIASHLGTKDDEDDEPYPDEEYDVKSEDGRIWDFVDASDIYKTKKEAKEDY